MSLVLYLFTFHILSAQVNETETPEFNTPEAAIEYFIKSVKNNDIYDAFKACAVYEYSENFDFSKYTEYIQAMILGYSPAPSGNEIFTQINIIDRMYTLSSQIKYLCYSLLSEEIADGNIIFPENDQRVSAFIQSLDTSRLSDLEIVEIKIPFPDVITSERYNAFAEKLAACFGADTATERIVLYRFEGSYFASGFHLLLYGDNWKIDGLNSAVAGTSPLTVIEPCPPEAFR